MAVDLAERRMRDDAARRCGTLRPVQVAETKVCTSYRRRGEAFFNGHCYANFVCEEKRAALEAGAAAGKS